MSTVVNGLCFSKIGYWKAGPFPSLRWEYIFPRLDKVCPWEGTEMKTDFFFREKVFLSEIVGKKDRLSNRAEQLSNRAERLSTRAKRG